MRSTSKAWATATVWVLCSQGLVKGAKHLLALDRLGEQCKLAVWVIPCGSEKRDNPLSNRS